MKDKRLRCGKDHHRWRGGMVHDSYGYILIRMPDHPRAHKNGYVYEHILVAEEKLGRPLKPEEVVHHDDEDRANNDWYNIIICDNKFYHNRLHTRRRAIEACGNPDWMRCCYCKQWDDIKDMYVRYNRRQAWHRECFNKRQRELRKVEKV